MDVHIHAKDVQMLKKPRNSFQWLSLDYPVVGVFLWVKFSILDYELNSSLKIYSDSLWKRQSILHH